MKISFDGKPNQSEQIEVSKASENSEYVFTITKTPIIPIDFKHIIPIDKSGAPLLDQQPLVKYSLSKDIESSSVIYKCNMTLPDQPQNGYLLTCPSISEQLTYKDYIMLENNENEYEYKTYQANSIINISIHFDKLENGLNNIKFGFPKLISPLRHIYAIRLSTLKETNEYHFVELRDQNEYEIQNVIFDKYTQLTWAVFDILYEITSPQCELPNEAVIIQKNDNNDDQSYLSFELKQKTSTLNCLTVLIESDKGSIIKSNFGLKNNINVSFSRIEFEQKIGELKTIMFSTDSKKNNEEEHIPLWYSKFGEFWIVDLLNCLFLLFEKDWISNDFRNLIDLLQNNPSKVTTLDFIAFFQSGGISLLKQPDYSKEFVRHILKKMFNEDAFDYKSSTIDDTKQVEAIFASDQLKIESNKKILILGGDGYYFSNKKVTEHISSSSSKYKLLFAVITKENSVKSFALPSYIFNEEVECKVQLMIYFSID